MLCSHTVYLSDKVLGKIRLHFVMIESKEKWRQPGKKIQIFSDIGNQVLSLAIRCISSFFGKFNIFLRKNTRKKKKNLNHEGHYYDRNSLKINLIIIGKQKHQQRDHFSEMVELIGS